MRFKSNLLPSTYQSIQHIVATAITTALIAIVITILLIIIIQEHSQHFIHHNFIKPMLRPRISPHAIFRSLFESEMQKHGQGRYGIPIVYGTIYEVIRKRQDDFMKSLPSFNPASYNAMMDNPSMFIYLDGYKQNNKDMEIDTSESKKKNMMNKMRMKYPIDEDMNDPLTDILVRSSKIYADNSVKDSKVSRIYEIDASLIEFLDKGDFAKMIDVIKTEALINMGLNYDEVIKIKATFNKFVIQFTGDGNSINNEVKENNDKETKIKNDNNKFGTLMIQLPSTGYKAGNIIATYGKDKTVIDISNNRSATYLAWFEGTEIEFTPLESGVRAFLSYDFMFDDNNNSKDPTTEESHQVSLKSNFHQQLQRSQQLKQSATVKAYKKMIKTKSFIYPVMPIHGFVYEKTDDDWYDDRYDDPKNKEIERKNRMKVESTKIMSIEAYGGLDKFEMGLFKLTVAGYQERESKGLDIYLNFAFTHTPSDDECIHDGHIPQFTLKNPFNWIAQRIYPMHDHLLEEIWGATYSRDTGVRFYETFDVIMIWPREFSNLISRVRQGPTCRTTVGVDLHVDFYVGKCRRTCRFCRTTVGLQ